MYKATYGLVCRNHRALNWIVGILLMGYCCVACSNNDFTGEWSDNATVSSQIGTLFVAIKTISIGNRIYSVASANPFGSGVIYRVLKVSRHPDSLGCGTTGKVQYLILLPMTATLGTSQAAIRVIFYGGSQAPTSTNIDDDPAVCAVHSFGRKPAGN